MKLERKTEAMLMMGLVLLSGCGEDGEGSDDASDSGAAVSDEAVVGDAGADASIGVDRAPFPPDNPFAADSPWPMSHRNSYTQSSSPFAGPTAASPGDVRFVPAGLSITLALSSAYEDGARAIWGAELLSGSIFKLRAATGLIYCIGKRGQSWTLEGIDWETGESVFFQKTGEEYNSTYAATEIGANGTIVTGVTGGVVAVGSNN